MADVLTVLLDVGDVENFGMIRVCVVLQEMGLNAAKALGEVDQLAFRELLIADADDRAFVEGLFDDGEIGIAQVREINLGDMRSHDVGGVGDLHGVAPEIGCHVKN